VAILVVLIPLAGLLGLGVKLAAYGRDRLGAMLLVAIPASALILAAALVGMVANDWESYTDCVEGCSRPDDLQLALGAAEVAGYGFVGLLSVAAVRWLILVVAGLRRTGRAQ
jgi:hypothetical protein